MMPSATHTIGLGNYYIQTKSVTFANSDRPSGFSLYKAVSTTNDLFRMECVFSSDIPSNTGSHWFEVDRNGYNEGLLSLTDEDYLGNAETISESEIMEIAKKIWSEMKSDNSFKNKQTWD